MIFHIDSVTDHEIVGWAIDPKRRPVAIEIFSGKDLLAHRKVGIDRADVARAYPNEPDSANAGFRVPFALRPGPNEIQVFLVAGSERKSILSKRFYGLDVDAIEAANEHAPAKGPFPAAAIHAVAKLLHCKTDNLASEASQMEFAERLVWLSQRAEIARVPGLLVYFRYLRETWAHCQFVDRYFPTRNPRRKEDDNDVSCRQSTSAEMMSIIHHLYVLHSEGVGGAFAEFGCFKGFSTSKLSFACGLLGIPMQVFDSFEGLPHDDSGYYPAGDFAGSLEEVTGNVRVFGRLEAVTFHKGFFVESLGRIAIPRLMSLFMDVDLMSSARDVMAVAEKLDPRGVIFSHECSLKHFESGAVVPGKAHGGNVVLPIAESFAARNIPLSGRHVSDNTGAFWASETAVPIAYNAAVMTVAAKV